MSDCAGLADGGTAPVSAVMRHVCVAAVLVRDRPLLNVFRNADVRDAPPPIGGAHRHIHHVDRVRSAHHALVEDRNIHEQLVQVDVLLVVHADQIAEGVSGDGQHRLLIALRVVESVQQMHAARARGGAAYSEAPGVFRVAHGGKCGGFFMPHLDELQLVLMGSQRFEESIHSVARENQKWYPLPIRSAVPRLDRKSASPQRFSFARVKAPMAP